MSTSQLFRCTAVLVALATCSSADDRVERFLQSIEQNRSARMIFDYDFRRDSPLLERPLTSATQREFEIRDSVGRAVTLRPVPKEIEWDISGPQLGEEPAPGEGLFFRTEIVRRRSQLLIVNAVVSTSNPTYVNAGSTPRVRVKVPTMSTSGKDDRSHAEQKRELLRRVSNNFALGVVLHSAIEHYVGKANDRIIEKSAGKLSCVSETRFGKCTLHWDTSAAVYPDRMTVEVSVDDILFNKPLSQWSTNAGKGYPDGGVLSASLEISDITTATYANQVVPTAWTTTESYKCTDGSVVLETSTIRLLDFSLETDESSAGQVKTVLPIGHKVHVDDGTPYVWNGKWAVPLDVDWRNEIP